MKPSLNSMIFIPQCKIEHKGLLIGKLLLELYLYIK